MWIYSARIGSRRHKNVEINIGASDDSLKRFAVANQDKRSDKALPSSSERPPSREASFLEGTTI